MVTIGRPEEGGRKEAAGERLAYRPVQTGERFSRKAAMPSW